MRIVAFLSVSNVLKNLKVILNAVPTDAQGRQLFYKLQDYKNL